jgi:hypothetical protein
MRPDHDGWLDAFAPEDLADPELRRIDAATVRALAAIGRGADEAVDGPHDARRRRPRRGLVLLAAAAVLAAGAGWLALGGAPAPSATAVATAGGPPEVVVPLRRAAAPVAEPVEVVRRATPRPAVAPRPPAEVGFGAGLVADVGTEVVRRGDDAVLRAGLLEFVREDGVDPGVGRVVFEELPLVAEPVGTVFTTVAGSGAAGVAVRRGHVALRHLDGRPVADVRTGESVLVLADPAAPLGLRVVSLRGLDLAAVRDAIAPGGRTSPSDAVSLVARLRLAQVDEATRHDLFRPGGVP